MSSRIAFYLRKLADFFDPKVKPSESGGNLTVRIEADTSQCMEAIEQVGQALRVLDVQIEKFAKLGAALEVGIK